MIALTWPSPRLPPAFDPPPRRWLTLLQHWSRCSCTKQITYHAFQEYFFLSQLMVVRLPEAPPDGTASCSRGSPDG